MAPSPPPEGSSSSSSASSSKGKGRLSDPAWSAPTSPVAMTIPSVESLYRVTQRRAGTKWSFQSPRIHKQPFAAGKSKLRMTHKVKVPKFGEVFNEGSSSKTVEKDVDTEMSEEEGPSEQLLSGVVVIPEEATSGSTTQPTQDLEDGEVPDGEVPTSPTSESSESTMPETMPTRRYDPAINVRTYDIGMPADVEIHVLNDCFHLHSNFLRSCSGWFRSSLSDEWFHASSGDFHPGHRSSSIRIAYVMEFDEVTQRAFLVPMGKARPDRARPHVNIFPMAKGVAKKLSGETHTHAAKPYHEHLAKAFSDMIDSYYRVPLELTYLFEAEYLIDTAEQFKSLNAIAPAINTWIICNPGWYRSLADCPMRYLLLSLRIHAPTVFKEAFIHCAGRWHLKAMETQICKEQNANITFESMKSKDWGQIYRENIPRPALSLLKDEVMRINWLTSQAFKRMTAFKFGPDKPETVKRTIRDHLAQLFKEHGGYGREGVLFRKVYNYPFDPTLEEIAVHKKLWKGKGTPSHLKKAMAPSVKVMKKMCLPFVQNHTLLNEQEAEARGYLLCAEWPEGKLWGEGGHLQGPVKTSRVGECVDLERRPFVRAVSSDREGA